MAYTSHKQFDVTLEDSENGCLIFSVFSGKGEVKRYVAPFGRADKVVGEVFIDLTRREPTCEH